MSVTLIDLASVRERVRTIETRFDPTAPRGGFLSVSDALSGADAMAYADAVPPAAYVSLASETPDRNRLASGGRAQRVRSRVSVLFCLGAERADDERADAVERCRGALIASLTGFKPTGAVDAFDYAGYSLRAQVAGLLFGEVLFSTSWDLRTP